MNACYSKWLIWLIYSPRQFFLCTWGRKNFAGVIDFHTVKVFCKQIVYRLCKHYTCSLLLCKGVFTNLPIGTFDIKAFLYGWLYMHGYVRSDEIANLNSQLCIVYFQYRITSYIAIYVYIFWYMFVVYCMCMRCMFLL